MTSQGVIQFIDDDSGYLAWLESSPHGFVVNSHRSPTPDYLILHRTSCKSISTASRSHWTSGYIKTCSNYVDDLRDWASTVGGRLKPCGMCRPSEQFIPSAQP